MKVILSRKGFDSKFGGSPSPILLDQRLISIPIPVEEGKDDRIRYRDLRVDTKLGLVDLMQAIGLEKIRVPPDKTWQPVPDLPAHLDPDLRRETYSHKPGWRGLFGQSSTAQIHLESHNVGEGDLFLFFGWFKKYKDGTERKDFPSGRHVIFGYLFIDEVLQIHKNETRSKLKDWMEYHPHVGRDFKSVGDQNYKKNTLYVAKETVKLHGHEFPGYGTFIFRQKDEEDDQARLTLTKKGCSRSKWDLPQIFNGVEMSYHSQSSWKPGYFQSAHIGQAFVVDNPEVEKWAEKLIERFAQSTQ